MYNWVNKGIIIAIAVLFTNMAAAQISPSPFTSSGIGDLVDLNTANNIGAGGVGVSNTQYWYMNTLNPALLANNNLTIFSAGISAGTRTVSNGSSSENYTGGTLRYLATAIPVIRGKWTTGFGLSPYSNVDYNITDTTATVSNTNDVVHISENGTGGLAQVYWANGVRISNDVFIGAKATYLFSFVEKNFTNEIQRNDQIIFTPSVNNRVSASDFVFQLSVAAKKDSVFNKNYRLNFGATYDFATDVKSTFYESVELLRGGQPVINDTLQNRSNAFFRLPHAIRAGVSLNKGINWMVGLDVKFQSWADYVDVNGNSNGLRNGFKVMLGGEITPDPSSVTSYFKRMTYRAGLSFDNTPYYINGTQVNEFGINFGWSLPVSRYSVLDMAFEYGQRGSASDTFIEENYFNFTLGVTINDQWFIRSKYD